MKLSTAVISILALLCLLDVAATQYELGCLGVHEANGLMLPLIALGWASVWTVKISLSVLILITGRHLWQRVVGRFALCLSTLLYSAVTLCHAIILFQ